MTRFNPHPGPQADLFEAPYRPRERFEAQRLREQYIEPTPELFQRLKAAGATLVDVPRAANADPETSHEAADRIKASGALGKQQRLVADAVRHWPGYTSAELAQELAICDGVELSDRRAMVARRLPELKGIHVAQRAARTCRVTGSKCVTWWPL